LKNSFWLALALLILTLSGCMPPDKQSVDLERIKVVEYMKGFDAAKEAILEKLNLNAIAHRDSCKFYEPFSPMVQGLAGVNCDQDFSKLYAEVNVSPSEYLRPALVGLGLVFIMGLFVFGLIYIVVTTVRAFASEVAVKSGPIKQKIIDQAVAEAETKKAHLVRQVEALESKKTEISQAIRSKNADLTAANDRFEELTDRIDDMESRLEAALEIENSKASAAQLKIALQKLKK